MSILKHRKRGISMELENKLNEFLADLNVFYRKLQNYNNLLSYFEELNKKAIEIKEEAEIEKDYATSSLIDEYILDYGKIIWMLKHVTSE